jgi:hypothetical protein
MPLGEVHLNNIYLYNFEDLADINTKTSFYLSNIHLIKNAGILFLNPWAVATIQSSTDVYASSTSSVVLGDSTLSSNSTNFPMNINHLDSSIYIDKALHLIMKVVK